jgi:protein ImuA
MGALAEKIERLRGSLLPPEEARPLVPLGHGPADASLKGGLKCGSLHEVYSAETGHEGTATGFALMLALTAAGQKPLLFIRQDFTSLESGEISAAGLLELGANPERILLFRAAHIEDALRATGEGLSCTSLGAVILETWGQSKLFDLSLSRRLTLAAARTNVSIFHVRAHATPSASAAETRWLVRACASFGEDWGTPVFDASLVRNRHGTTGQWVMEWNADDRTFREAAHPRRLAAAAFDRPAQTAVGARRRYG